MSKQKSENQQPPRREDRGLVARVKLWMKKNEKVVWTVLLICIAPLFAFPVMGTFGDPSRNSPVVAHLYGDAVTFQDQKRVVELMKMAQRVAPTAVQGAGDLLFSQAPEEASGRAFDPLNFFLYKATARRLGIRVSDAELSEHIRQLWREQEAAVQARLETQNTPTPQAQARFTFFRNMEEKLAQLNEQNVFNAEKWVQAVDSAGLYSIRAFEGFLHELYLIGKLQAYVQSSVKVSGAEIFKRYNKELEKRKLSWVGFKPTDVLLAKLQPSVTDGELVEYYSSRENQYKFYRPLGVRAAYLHLSREYFLTEAEKSVTDEKVEDHYQQTRNDYRTGTIRSDESLFALRTVEEQKELRESVYRPLSEVQDEVRQALIETTADRSLRAVGREIQARLKPFGAAAAEPATPEDIKEQYPFVEIGLTDYATQADAEEVFGDFYSFAVLQWLNAARSNQPVQAPDYPVPLKTGGSAFYTRVDVRRAGQPRLQDVRDDVLEAITKERAVNEIQTALDAVVKGVEPDVIEETVSHLVSNGFEVAVGEERFRVDSDGGLVTAVQYSTKNSQALRLFGELVYLPAVEEDKGDGEGDGQTDSSEQGDETEAEKKDDVADSDETDDELSKEETLAFSSARPLIDEAFLTEKGALFVAQDLTEGICFLGRVDDLQDADPVEFENRKEEVERLILNEERLIYLAEWRRELLAEAGGATEVAASTDLSPDNG